ncbi:antiviral protein MAP [Spinacia oleracea]|uniref:rRNA N-glycosylase n=1 Tax=Spinacia oleracea TaxID=3562 RepID=A0A9R0JPM1_SPIOL|nr:antiviral protein MAP-like [Spinacia oleracea]XP_021841936.2 antiviral protein MAP-like [Spinacia oleracea]
MTTTKWVWWCTVIMVVVMLPLTHQQKEQVGKKLGAFTTVTFELSSGLSGYSQFLTRLRNAVEAPSMTCGLPSTLRTPLRGKEYVHVDIKLSNTQKVTIGIDVMDLYVWGYKDIFNGKHRATFFGNTPKDAKDKLFPDTTVSRTTKFLSTYVSLERYAKVGRKDLELKLKTLEDGIKSVYGKPEKELGNAAEAKFVLIAIQMVAEAARFKFMENGIVNFDSSKAFKNKMIAFQNDWDPASQAIHKASPKCTTISPTLIISNIDYRQEVKTVDQIKNDMGLLKYKKSNTPLFTWASLSELRAIIPV